jgi:TPR repeat protein
MRRLAAIASIPLLLLAACSDGPPRPSAKQAELYMEGLGGRGTMVRSGTDVNALYAEAVALQVKGDCPNAIPKLEKVANLGVGYEGAQTALGECLLQKAGTTDLSANYLEGLTWLRRAADAGWPEAQFHLAAAHALGPTAIRNGDEAGYWWALYTDNTGKKRVGFVPPPADQLAAVDAAIPAASKAAGKARAAHWQRQVWTPPAPANAPGPTGRRVQRRGTEDGPGRPTEE